MLKTMFGLMKNKKYRTNHLHRSKVTPFLYFLFLEVSRIFWGETFADTTFTDGLLF